MKESKKTNKRQLVGTVVSVKNTNTVGVKVINKKLHPLYKKVVNQNRRYSAANSIEGIEVGDTVKIQESRPLSKTKKWVVVEKLVK